MTYLGSYAHKLGGQGMYYANISYLMRKQSASGKDRSVTDGEEEGKQEQLLTDLSVLSGPLFFFNSKILASCYHIVAIN